MTIDGQTDPIHTPETFGPATAEVKPSSGTPSQSITEMTVIDATGDVPDAVPGKTRPAVKRLLSADRANLITFNFSPGQSLPHHKAAHPITVQCLQGTLEFTCGNQSIDMKPGVVAHLPAYSVHRVDCPKDAPTAENILLLTMLTGESSQR